MVAVNKYHVDMPGNGYHPEYRNGFMRGVAATEAAVEKFTSTNTAMPKCLCESCTYIYCDGWEGKVIPDAFTVTKCRKYSGTSA